VSEYTLIQGTGRTGITLEAKALGDDLVVFIYNINAHIGALALAEWDAVHRRSSVSLITRLGHKDDSVAQAAAYKICKIIHKPVCVIAGIHLEDITLDEIKKFGENADLIVEAFLKAVAEQTAHQ
jgi:gallate decarboxylase subunit D